MADATVHRNLFAVARNGATFTHPTFCAICTLRQAGLHSHAFNGHAGAGAVIAVTTTRTVKKVASDASPPRIAAATLGIEVAAAVTRAVKVVDTRTAFFCAEFSTPASAWVRRVFCRLWRTVAALDSGDVICSGAVLAFAERHFKIAF
jgi:hypothetical protein